MSQYAVTGNDKNYEILFGWDAPLNTYFLHVIDKTKYEDDPKRDVLWMGTQYGEIKDLYEILSWMKPFADTTKVSWSKLYEDANG